MNKLRSAEFQRNESLEYLLGQINADLQPAEAKLIYQYYASSMEQPLILVMGPLRSGTTLFTQWLANTDLVAYPTNLLSRFYQAPIIGAKIQLLLTDRRYNFRDELGEFAQQSEFKSENGKTKGVLAPNEFWYFWRRFLKEPGRDVWLDDELRESMDTATMKAEVIGIMDVFRKPFAAKGMLFNYNIPFLDSVFPKMLFIQIKRNPVSNISSILEARKRQFGSESEWYSFKIPEYSLLRDLDPITQSAGQLHFINTAVTKGMEMVSEERKLVVHYEDFCNNPRHIHEKLLIKLGIPPNTINYSGPEQFTITRNSDLPNKKLIIKALDKFLGNNIRA